VGVPIRNLLLALAELAEVLRNGLRKTGRSAFRSATADLSPAFLGDLAAHLHFERLQLGKNSSPNALLQFGRSDVADVDAR
jgi:hypothetical protein